MRTLFESKIWPNESVRLTVYLFTSSLNFNTYFMLNSNYRMDFICCWTILLGLHWKFAGVEKVSFLRGQRSLHWQLSVRPFIFWQQPSCFVTLEKPQRRLPTGDWDGQKSIFDTSGKGRDFWDPMSIRLLRTWNM